MFKVYQMIQYTNSDYKVIGEINKIALNLLFMSKLLGNMSTVINEIDNSGICLQTINLQHALNENHHPITDLFTLIEDIHGLTFIVFPMGRRISSICIRNTTDIIVAVNSDMSIDRQYLILFYELHNLFSDDKCLYINNPIDRGSGSEIEKQVGKFISHPNLSLGRYGVYGNYIRMAKKLLDSDMISVGKYEELLLAAYRADLVY